MGLAVSGVRSMVETVLETTARFVSWSMATPLGAVPTETAMAFPEESFTGARFTRSRTETVFAELLVTTATPEVFAGWPVYVSLGRTATAVGEPPVGIDPRMWPRLGFGWT